MKTIRNRLGRTHDNVANAMSGFRSMTIGIMKKETLMLTALYLRPIFVALSVMPNWPPAKTSKYLWLR